MQQWIDEADIQTTEAYNEITYDNTKDYLPADVQTVLNSDTSDDDGNAQTEDCLLYTAPAMFPAYSGCSARYCPAA